jgi:hypothetical protein
MRALLLGIALGAFSGAAHAQSLEVIGYAGVLGEWELVASVTKDEATPAGEFSGALTMTHVGICTQDGPEQRTGEIRVRIASPRLDATLSLAGLECTYSAALTDAYTGQMICPGRAALPLKLWLR